MPAPNIATLYDFESWYEDAYVTAANALNGSPFAQLLTPRTVAVANENTDFYRTPRIAVRMAVSGVGVQELLPGHAKQQEDHYLGILTLDLVTSRDNTSQDHGYLRGLARSLMLMNAAIFNSNTVPYYQTVQVLPGPSVQMVGGAENDELLTQMQFPIEWAILEAALPDDSPPP